MGALGDLGWYSIGAIELAYNYELPEKVLATSVRYSETKAIISCSAMLYFKGGRVG